MNSKLLVLVSLSIVACSGRAVDVGTDGPDETTSAVKSPKSSGSSTPSPSPAPSSSSSSGKQDVPDSDDDGDDGLPDASTPPDPSGDAGSDCSPTTAIQCTNGHCACSAGPSKGKSCDGTVSSGSSSCSVLCAFCD